VFSQKDAAAIGATFDCTTTQVSVAYASVQVCYLTGTCTSNQDSYAWQFVPMTGGLGFAGGGSGFDVAAGATLESLLRMGVTQVGTTMVAANDMGVPPNVCTPADFMFPEMTMSGVCADGPQTFGYQSQDTVGGACMLPAAQNISRQAMFQPMFTAADDYLWVTQFNLKKSDQPMWQLTAH
jgi:hypothetical protein